MTVTTLLTATYVVGISAEAMTAALSAGRQRLDFFAVSLLAAITAFGGGTVRDVLLGHYPLVWVENPVYLIVVLAAAAITVSLSFFMHYFRSLFLALDAVGLAAFTVLGTQVGRPWAIDRYRGRDLYRCLRRNFARYLKRPCAASIHGRFVCSLRTDRLGDLYGLGTIRCPTGSGDSRGADRDFCRAHVGSEVQQVHANFRV